MRGVNNNFIPSRNRIHFPREAQNRAESDHAQLVREIVVVARHQGNPIGLYIKLRHCTSSSKNTPRRLWLFHISIGLRVQSARSDSACSQTRAGLTPQFITCEAFPVAGAPLWRLSMWWNIGRAGGGTPTARHHATFKSCRASRLCLKANFWHFFLLVFRNANFDNMSTSDQEDDRTFVNRHDKPIGPLQHRAQTWNTGAVRPTLRGIAQKKIILKKNTYEYKEIAYHDDIRILKILHGKENSALECMLFPSSLRSTKSTSKFKCHEYSALSYWWGEDHPTHPVTMYDDTGVREGLQTMTPFNSSGKFYIRDNLAAALKQFRKETEDVNVWVDALCINQENVKEKTAQVARMDIIYSEATYVCVWLGAGQPESKETFDFLKYEILNLKTLDDLVKTSSHARKWRLVVNMMKNRWFSRRWVIQELALAKKAIVRWGSEEIQWSNFADAIALFMTKHDEIAKILEGKEKTFSAMQDPDTHIGNLDPRVLGANTLVNASTNLFRRSPDGTIKQRLVNLEVLVSALFLAFEAGEPKDTIYAVLSLAKDTMARPKLASPPSWEVEPVEEPPAATLFQTIFYSCLCCFRFLIDLLWADSGDKVPVEEGTAYEVDPDHNSKPVDPRIAPDYDKSLTDVCADFMEYCIETSQSLDILCRHWAPQPKRPTALEELKGSSVEEVERMPSWIPSIEGHAYGGPLDTLQGRKNGDSLVGCHERQNHQHYHASGNLHPSVEFGKCRQEAEAFFDATLLENPTQPNRSSLRGSTVIPKSPNQPIETSLQLGAKKFDGTLHVKGFKLDTIKNISGRVSGGIIPVEAFEFGGWPNVPAGGRPPDEVPDELWRTLVADRGFDGTNAPAWYRRACLEILTHVDNNGDLNTNKFKDIEDTPATMKLFLKRVRNVVWNRKFFLTAGEKDIHGKLYGLAPKKAEKNDIICILFGCSVPVILREVEGEDRYIFIGECYAHGIMDGESLYVKMPEHPYPKVRGFTLI
jgi:hypothetical protein